MKKDLTYKRKGREREYQKEYNSRRRLGVIKLLGGKCKHCGFERKDALQIDHVNGDGFKDRKSLKKKATLYDRVRFDVSHGSKKYQLLCANCNWIKRAENGEVAGADLTVSAFARMGGLSRWKGKSKKQRSIAMKRVRAGSSPQDDVQAS